MHRHEPDDARAPRRDGGRGDPLGEALAKIAESAMIHERSGDMRQMRFAPSTLPQRRDRFLVVGHCGPELDGGAHDFPILSWMSSARWLARNSMIRKSAS